MADSPTSSPDVSAPDVGTPAPIPASDVGARAGTVDRRRFLHLSVGGLAALTAGVRPSGPVVVPADKGYSAAAYAALADRGVPTSYTGAPLAHIGMPVGGITCGQLYLGGDGRLWWWDIDNPPEPPVSGLDFFGAHYNSPVSYLDETVYRPRFRQGFALRVTAGGSTATRSLDAAGPSGWPDSAVTFTGKYPLGQVAYQDSALPVNVQLQAFTPYVPTSVDDSSLPATVMQYTITNTSAQTVSGTVAGWSDSPVLLSGRARQPVHLTSAVFTANGATGVSYAAVDPRPDIVFADFESGDYAGWTAAGTAFGPGPVTSAQLPSYMKTSGPIGEQGRYFVTSHAFWSAAGDVGRADAATGTLTSRPFTITRRYVSLLVGGGNQPGTACVNVIVGGRVVGSATGANSELLAPAAIDVAAYQGQTATIQAVDNASGAWGHISFDDIVFTDDPSRPDVVVADFENGYGSWTATGTAFGPGPLTEAQLPPYMKRSGPIGVHGSSFVTSHAFWSSNGDAGAADAATGTLTSPAFTVTRDYLGVLVGGGNQPGTACVNVLVGGVVVATATGRDDERLRQEYLDLRGHQGQSAVVQVVDTATGPWGHINCDYFVLTDHRSDRVFEDFENGYGSWTATGTAFGPGPVTEAQLPPYMKRSGPIGVHGSSFVTSHAFWSSNGDAGAADAATGTLTSPAFTIDRRYVRLLVGGGYQPGTACVNVVVGGKVVGSATGGNDERLTVETIDVSAYQGRNAVIQAVDTATGAWGHISFDYVVFSDDPLDAIPITAFPDDGSFALASPDSRATAVASLATAATLADVFDAAGTGPTELDAGLGTITGAVRVPFSLAPGASTTVTFLVGWYFPTPRRSRFANLQGAGSLMHYYSTRFASAQDVVGHLAADQARLIDSTLRWVKTYYDDSTLPYWFLERAMASATTLATTACYRFDSGRFYALEGVYCCDGTCEHVWNYAQAPARLFPALERDTRQRVDLGIGFHTGTGAMDYRAEYGTIVAADGQCGTVLRIYREHQMAPDSTFLTTNWPRIKLAVQYLITVLDGHNSGVLAGGQYNTLDQTWYGEIPWISGMYVAALLAAQAMATEMGDGGFAGQCGQLAAAGSAYLAGRLWNASDGYFIQQIDPAHTATNSDTGCYADQLFGQTYADQLGLPRVFPADKSAQALANLYKYNFLPNPLGYRATSPIGEIGRVFAAADEPGLLLCTWPFGTSTDPAGGGDMGAVAYFNEVWTGVEYQAAAGMLGAGLTDQALAVTRAVYDRYHAEKRNPYNEIECSEHYSRAMMGLGVFLAAGGYAYHGPRGHLGFAPAISPEAFQAAFTTATGWGSYTQSRAAGAQTGTIELRYGTLKLNTLAFDTASPPTAVTISVGGSAVPSRFATAGSRTTVTLTSALTLSAGQTLTAGVAL